MRNSGLTRWTLLLFAAGCADRSLLVPQALPTVLLRTFHLSGRVVSDAGVPLSHAVVTFFFQPTSISIEASQRSVFTDSSGQYSTAFTARLGGFASDTTGAFTFAQISADGYEDDARYVLPSAKLDSANFSLYAVETIVAGDSIAVTLRASDPVCPSVQAQCRTVRIASPDSGQLVMSLTDIGAASQIFASFAIDQGGDDDCCVYGTGGQLSFPVAPAETITIRLITPPTAPQLALLRTRLAR